MRHLRTIVAAVAVAAAAASTLPADARVARPVELTESTTIVASTTGWVDVVVPEDATLSPAVRDNPDVTISGTGRYVGIELIRRGANQAESWQTQGMSSYRFPAFTGLGNRTYGSGSPDRECDPELVPGDPLPESCSYPDQQRIVLLQGHYRLWVLADNAPLTITLRLRGLDAGETQVSPAKRLRSTQKPLPQSDSLDDTVVTYGALGLPGYVWGAVFATAKGSTAPTLESESTCMRQDEKAPPPFAYDSRCHGGTGGMSMTTVRVAGQERTTWSGFVSSSSEPPTAPVGLGGAFTDSGGVTLGTTLGVWYEPPPE